MPTFSSSTSGNRSRVASRGRPSTTMVRYPSDRASVTSGIATWLPPTTRRVGGGRCTSTNTLHLLARAEPHGPRHARRQRAARRRGGRLVEGRIGQRALAPPVVEQEELGPGVGGSIRVRIAPEPPTATWLRSFS